jgi:hypothetical protein
MVEQQTFFVNNASITKLECLFREIICSLFLYLKVGVRASLLGETRLALPEIIRLG